MVLGKAVKSSKMDSKQVSSTLRAAKRAMASLGTEAARISSLKLPELVYYLISQLSKLPQHVGNNLLGKGSLQPVAILGKCQLKAKGVGPEVFNIDGGNHGEHRKETNVA